MAVSGTFFRRSPVPNPSRLEPMPRERKLRIGRALRRQGLTVMSRRSRRGIGSRGSHRLCRTRVHGQSPGKSPLDIPRSELANEFSAHSLHSRIIHQLFHSGLGRGRESDVSHWMHWRKKFQNLSENLRFARARPSNGCRRRLQAERSAGTASPEAPMGRAHSGSFIGCSRPSRF